MVLQTEGSVAIFLYWLGTLRFICYICDKQKSTKELWKKLLT